MPPKPSPDKREPHQKKQAIPGHKSTRGVPENPYGEPKGNCNFSLTATCKRLLKEQAAAHGISNSELLEQFVRDPGKFASPSHCEHAPESDSGDSA